MKTKILTLSMIAFLAITSISCSNDDDSSTPATTAPISTNVFTATINAVLATESAGGTQAFTATGTNGKSFSSAIFPSQFPIGQATNIAYSSSMTYKVGDVTYIPREGTMTLTIMENYNRMKGSFTGVFVSGSAPEIAISGEFDISK
jgi:hypothetical protein